MSKSVTSKSEHDISLVKQAENDVVSTKKNDVLFAIKK